ncbi:hypothetical protein SUGI_0849570 [Cryptomeria japonica]|nr:hypothetical protein SUGI_0849570 [Cryptomeria japonica]
MVERFEVICKCTKQEELSDSPNEQVSRLLNKANDKEVESVIQILGVYYWSNGHVHDGVVMENLFDPIVQVLGNPSTAIRMVRRMVREDIYEGVMGSLDSMETVPASECMLGYFDLEAQGKKVKMQKAWSLFRAGVMKDYSLSKFKDYMRDNIPSL